MRADTGACKWRCTRNESDWISPKELPFNICTEIIGLDRTRLHVKLRDWMKVCETTMLGQSGSRQCRQEGFGNIKSAALLRVCGLHTWIRVMLLVALSAGWLFSGHEGLNHVNALDPAADEQVHRQGASEGDQAGPAQVGPNSLGSKARVDETNVHR